MRLIPVIIQGVFSMSILKRLKSLLFRTVDKEELDKSKDVKLSSDESDVTSSKNKLSDDSIDSETKTSEVISKKVPVTEEKVSSAKDIPSNKEAEDSKKIQLMKVLKKLKRKPSQLLKKLQKRKKRNQFLKLKNLRMRNILKMKLQKRNQIKKIKRVRI